MRIERIEVKDFRGFASRAFEFSPSFNVLIGDNGTGKTAILDALSIAAGAIFLGLEGATPPGIHRDDVRLGMLVASRKDGAQLPFDMLSDGARSMLAMVGNIAYRSATLNPHLREQAPSQTPGIVLIDELDLHLHPNWQREVVDDLRKVFPLLQFVATTHSPFIVQSLRENERINLDDQSRETLPSSRGSTSCHPTTPGPATAAGSIAGRHGLERKKPGTASLHPTRLTCDGWSSGRPRRWAIGPSG